jgi:hypothetical protein
MTGSAATRTTRSVRKVSTAGTNTRDTWPGGKEKGNVTGSTLVGFKSNEGEGNVGVACTTNIVPEGKVHNL